MGIIGGRVGYWILRRMAPQGRSLPWNHDSNHEDTKLKLSFGEDFFDIVKGKTVLDFGCGAGRQAVEMALMGADRVIGLDIQEGLLANAEQLARRYSVSDRCAFVASNEELVDIVISKDAFEHFSDPATILRHMSALLKPGGFVLASFGPTWLHPFGGHLFSVFPWGHLIFTEQALIRWRSDFKSDGATKFSEVEGGLNQLTIRRFEKFVDESPLRLVYLYTVPIKGIRLLKRRVFREFGSSIVCCKLELKENSELLPRPTIGSGPR
jgi:SAM-dependent methyltransferase